MLRNINKSYRVATLYIEYDGLYIDFNDDSHGKRRLASQHCDTSWLEGYLNDLSNQGYRIHQLDNTRDNGL